MEEYISRRALIAEYDRVHVGAPGGARKLMVDAPTADVVEVVHATWVENDDGKTICSNCHSEAGIDAWEMEMRDKKRYDKSPYCPQCGAKMKGV